MHTLDPIDCTTVAGGWSATPFEYRLVAALFNADVALYSSIPVGTVLF
jgi:hypothetical protein